MQTCSIARCVDNHYIKKKMSSMEYFDIKEDFSILSMLAKRIDAIHEIRDTYPQLENVSLKDAEAYLCQRYSEKEHELINKMKL